MLRLVGLSCIDPQSMAAPAKAEVSVGESNGASRTTDPSRFLLGDGGGVPSWQSVQLGSSTIPPAGSQPRTPTMFLGDSGIMRASRLGAGRPEDISYRGVNLILACVKGDLPLVAMLLAEGTQQGLDMLAPDKVSEPLAIRLHRVIVRRSGHVGNIYPSIGISSIL